MRWAQPEARPRSGKSRFAWQAIPYHVALAVLAFSGAFLQAQTTTVNLATQSRNPDFSSFPFTRPVTVGNALPVACQVGQLFFNSAALPGANLYGCTSTNNWTLMASTTVPQITIVPAALSFGTQTVGIGSVAKTITITNTGTTFLSLAGINLIGGNSTDFLVASPCGNVVPSGATCVISVTFKPSLVGAESSSLAINGNEPGSPVVLPLAGTGIAAITSGGLIVTPSAIYAGENGVVTLTANRPVNWTLANGSSGTLKALSSTLATYTAPATIPAQNVIGSCQATPNDSVFNTRIDALPLESHSAAWTNNMGPIGLTFQAAWGTNIADSTTPVRNMSFWYTAAYNAPFVMPQWPALKRENGTFGTRYNSTDHHIVTVRKDNCQFYEIYNDWFTPGVCRDGQTQGCNAQSGLTYAWNSYSLPAAGSTDAAGLPISPLMLGLAEVKSGVVNHAMRFTMAGGYIVNKPYWPANSSNGGCTPTLCPNNPSYGARFRLKASYDISKFSSTAQVILTALKRYGMFLADAGMGPTAAASTDVTEDAGVMAALSEIAAAQINMTLFEAVDESSFILAGNSARVNPANGFQLPSSFASVTATDQAIATYQVNFPVALQSVIVGLPSPAMTILAGTPGYQLVSWVNGTGNQNTTWSLVSGVGSVTPGGLYTAPAALSGPSPTVLRVTSTADPNAFSNLYVTNLPTGSNPAGSIRIDSGSVNGTTDSNGNVWLGDQAFESASYIQLAGDYPNWPALAGNAERSVYQSSGHTYGSDIVYSLVVPNGNYKVRVMLGQPYNGCGGCVNFNPLWHAPLHIEANGQITLHNFDFGVPIAYAYATPLDVFVPAQVTNNSLSLALRIDPPDSFSTAQPSPTINGLEIIPDSTPPFLVIDNQQQTSLKTGSTLQLYAVGWYMASSVSWSISGPGSINQSGLYTAPLSAASTQSVKVTATSTAVPGVLATTTLTIPTSGS